MANGLDFELPLETKEKAVEFIEFQITEMGATKLEVTKTSDSKYKGKVSEREQ